MGVIFQKPPGKLPMGGITAGRWQKRMTLRPGTFRPLLAFEEIS
jgi:hypothetical protein